MNRLPGASRPAQRITPQTASPVRYWLTPSHTTIAGRDGIEAGGAQQCIEVVDFEIDLDERHLVQIGFRRVQPRLLHAGVLGWSTSNTAGACQRSEPPGARVEAGTEQHHLVDLARRLCDPVVDQLRAGDAGGSRAWPAAVDVVVQQRPPDDREQSCRQSKFARQQRRGERIGKRARIRRPGMLRRRNTAMNSAVRLG